MSSKTVKNLSTLFAFVMLVAVMTSCNRGGVGCPYEMEAATNAIMHVIK